MNISICSILIPTKVCYRNLVCFSYISGNLSQWQHKTWLVLPSIFCARYRHGNRNILLYVWMTALFYAIIILFFWWINFDLHTFRSKVWGEEIFFPLNVIRTIIWECQPVETSLSNITTKHNICGFLVLILLTFKYLFRDCLHCTPLLSKCTAILRHPNVSLTVGGCAK